VLTAVTYCNISYTFSGTGKRQRKESGERQREICEWTPVQHVEFAASGFVPAMQQNPQH